MPIPEIALPHGQDYKFGEDPARFLVDPGDETWRPYLKTPGGSKFVFPVGTEGFRQTDNPTLGMHKYIGDDDIEASVVYRSEPHIEMSGTFPGHTAKSYMADLENCIKERTPDNGKILYLPGIFARIQYVLVESVEFTHDAEDRTRSIGYSISYLRVGAGRRISPEAPDPPDENPVVTGNPARFFVVKANFRTLRAIAGKVYKNGDKWNKLYALNKAKIDKLNIPRHKLPTAKLPLGMKVRY